MPKKNKGKTLLEKVIEKGAKKKPKINEAIDKEAKKKGLL